MSVSQPYVLGIDGGTESLRAGVFDGTTGRLLSSAAVAYPTVYPAPGWAEQSPADWWQALGQAVKEALGAASVNGSHIAAMCVDTTCCTVCALDAEGNAVRPALLWMDVRASREAAQVAACKGDPALRVNSAGAGPVSAEWFIPKSLWIKKHEPENWARAVRMCEYQEYINWKLTGNYVGSLNTASVRWHYCLVRGWPTSLLSAVGLEDLPAKWPQEVLHTGAPVGGLTEAAAHHLGLNPGLLVAQGGADAFIGMLGLGVTEPGKMALLTGSSHLQLGLSATEVTGQGIFGSYTGALIPDRDLHVVEGGQTSTGSIVNWFRRTLCGEGVTYQTLDEEAERVPPGCDGLLCLDHFQGARTPHTDPLSRGALCGLTLAHTRGHIFRSILEGVAFGTRLIMDTMGKAGYRPDSIAIAGGAAMSSLWLQIHADVAGLPFLCTEQTEAPMLGCAILAAVAAGLHPDVHIAAKAMVRISRVVHPQPHLQAAYEEHYQRYCQLHGALAPLMPGRTPPNSLDSCTQLQQPLNVTTEPISRAHSVKTLPASSRLRGILAPSILSADFAFLGAQVQAVLDAGAQWVHVDMFDGSSLAGGNLTIGPGVVRSLRRALPSAFLDCHLAVDNPSAFVDATIAAGASSVTFHVDAPCLGAKGTWMPVTVSSGAVGSTVALAEAVSGQEAALALARYVRSKGVRVGVALSPTSDVQAVMSLALAGEVDMVLLMTVTPGWGGQAFMTSVLPKVAALRLACPLTDIQVDGGVNLETAALAMAAGANVFVAGTAVFGAPDDPTSLQYKGAVAGLLRVIQSQGLTK